MLFVRSREAALASAAARALRSSAIVGSCSRGSTKMRSQRNSHALPSHVHYGAMATGEVIL